MYSPPDYNQPERFSLGRAPLVALAFSPDGEWLAIADKNGEITRWEVASQRTASSFRVEGDVSRLVFSPDGASLAAITRQGGIFLSRGESRAIALRGHQGEVHALAFSPDGTRLYSAEGAEVRGWLLPPLPSAWEGLSQAPRAVAFSSDGASLGASSEEGEVAVWSLAQPGAAPSVLLRHEKGEAAFAFSPDGRLLASGGADQLVRLTGISAGAGQTLGGHTGAVRALAFSASGDWLASGDEAGQLMLWPVVCVAQSGADACAAPILLGEKTGAVRVLAFSPQQSLLASGGEDGRVHLWDPLSGSERALSGPDGFPGTHADRVISLAFTADGRWLLSLGADGVLWIWSVETGRGSSLLAHGQEITRIAPAPAGSRFLSGGGDRLLRLWEIDEQGNPRELRSFAGHEAELVDIAFSPAGEDFMSSDALGNLRQWDLKSGESRVLEGRGQVAGLAISPDGSKIAAGGVEEASVWVYPDPLPRGALGISAWMALATNAEIDANNRLSVRRFASWWSDLRSSSGGAGWLFPLVP
jgi:WD40 repeat protein